MNEPTDAAPVVTDVTYRINERGDLFAVEFGCKDGQVRAVALSTAVLVKLIAGALWTAAEAGARRGAPVISPRVRAHMLENAPNVDAVRAVFDGKDPVMELQVGAAPVALKLPRETALTLAEQLVEALHPPARV